jgi:acyl transferase domain-containing protein/D-arabinose 1-dehydrogenase-like Zn-dependent alcohol dehydrogenase/acyl carrier protein
MEPMLEQFAEVAETLAYSEPKIPIVSNLTGEILSPEEATDPAYWVAHARAPVRFADAVETLHEQGASTYLELGPDPVLCAMARQCLGEGEGEAAFVPSLRESRPEAGALTSAIAHAHAAGAKVEWGAFFEGTGAKRVPLPTYPFQRKRYWLALAAGAASASAVGQSDPEHPLLSAAIEDPGDGRLTLTGRLSLATYPWLADHRVGGRILLPGTAFLELALRAAEQAGTEAIEELTLQSPLMLTEGGAAAIQASVSAPGEDGRREIAIYSRAEGDEDPWVLNASGALADAPAPPAASLDAWPPEGAEPLEVEYLYDRLAEHGLEYGPAFQNLSAAWQDGERIYAEVSLPEERREEAKRFAIHPALLDSALHGIGLAGASGSSGARLPFSWSGVSLWSAGAVELRVEIATRTEDEVSLSLADGAGIHRATIDSLVSRPVDPALLGGAVPRTEGLLGLEWAEVPLAEQDTSPAGVELLRCEAGAGADHAEAARSALEAVQGWLADAEKADLRLALITRGAMATAAAESPDPAAAAIWGLVRSAQSEHPGRFALIDSDGSEASEEALSAALAISAEEPQLALREGTALAPRLSRVGAGEDPVPQIDPARTVLVTGATGALGGLVARHLAERHGARRLLLISRSGTEAGGAAELRAELEGLGAEATIAACDVADRKALEGLLASIPASHPLGAVVHCAGTIADGTIEAMEPGQIDRVFAAKADGAWNLHEQTAGLDLSAFVLFSSAAGTLGGPGQANYAAANAFLDALAQRRQAEGKRATSIAWGLWEREGGMTAGLGEADLARMRRSGAEALSDERGLSLFDAALGVARPQVVAIPIDPARLRSLASTGALPPIFSGLVRAPKRRSVGSGSLAAKLATLPESEAESFVLDLVRDEVAAVLGHASAAEVEAGRAFQELGFDSLAAVELRNRLSAIAGLRLAATVVFDYPNSAALAEHLLNEATAGGGTARVAVRAQASEEPIAIVGMACRYPGGVASPEDLWRLVAEGRDGISGFPDDRGWDLGRLYDPDPEHAGTSYTREGGFLGDAAEFDSEFFGIAPREALVTDPQQRLLLEACWEALEDAGIDPASLSKTPTGVFAGAMYQDYGPFAGGSSSIVSGRIAYTLGLEGPAMTVDTACSSSLVTLHLASQALRGGECTLALAGGVTVLSTPGVFVEFSRQRGLAPDGRSKSFAEAADGVAWAEGVGVLVLERLSDARRNEHPVLALLRGSAVNQDGASNGLTAPNGPSQERVIRQALANARLKPEDIDVVEGHGTGTTLGDPIEAGALIATYGQERDEPLKLGSIKSNIGHTQAAAGVAGVIKMALAMREGVLPKTLHLDAPSSKVDWEAGKVELLSEQAAWEPGDRPRRAGVSSFGISGTNAHVIVEEAPELAPAGGDGGAGEGSGGSSKQLLVGPIMLPLAAKAESALAEAAGRLAAHLQRNPELDPTDVANFLATTRTAFEQRAVVLGKDRGELVEALKALAEGKDTPSVARGHARTEQRPVFLFPGQGAQAQGMALGLIESSPAFAKHMAACEQALAPHVDWSLTEVLADEDAKWLDRLDIVQPALFAVMVSLAKLWRECGVEPAAVVGHSQGEIAAAHIAGALSLEDAALIVAERGKAMAKIAGKGGMLSVSLTPGQLTPYTEQLGERVSLAAINGPASLVLSGDPEALDEVEAACEGDEVRAKRIAVDYAAHSSQIEALEEELLEAFAPISPQSAEIPMHSTVSGEQIDTAELGPEYWYRNLRQTVLLEPVLRSLLDSGKRAFVEIGPHPVLSFGAEETIEAALEDPTEAILLSTLRRGESEVERFALSLAQAHVRGVAVDWRAFFKSTGAKRVALPTYPFQRERYWIDSATGAADAGAIGLTAANHPLLGASVELAGGEGGDLLLTGRLSLATHPWLADHAVAGAVLLPGTAFVELALRAGEQVGAETVEELTLQAPLVLPETSAVAMQVALASPDEQGRREISIYSRPEGAAKGEPTGAQGWTCHATGALSEQPAATVEPLGAWPPEGAEPVEVAYLYDRLAEHGLEYGPAFQGLTAAWKEGEQIYAEASLSEEFAEDAERFGIHPALLDSALHGIGLAGSGPTELRLPFSWGGVSLQAQGARELRVRIVPGTGGEVSLALADGAGVPLATVDSLVTRPLDPAQLQSAGSRQEGLLGLEWIEAPLVEADTAPAEVELRICEIDTDVDAATAARKAAQGALEAVQQFLSEEAKADSRLAFVTGGAMATTEAESPDPAAAAIWGLVRSAQSEHPGRFALIDTDGSEASQEALAAALALAAQEPQLALREGAALAPRAMPAKDTEDSLIPPPGPWRLDVRERGTLESLALLPSTAASAPLGPTEVRIQMHAAGLNFREVLAVLGYEVPGGASLGGEGAGVVLEVGSEVSDLAPGERVMGVIPEAFATVAVSLRELLRPIPANWTFEEAAALPVVFSTAYYGLLDLAELKAGEKVLIHAGAGGVGMAAIQLARHIGAEVFATASPSKWEVLREMGIDEERIASSRDLEFKDKFLEATGGEGVDVVLNSLAGEFVDASLELLPRGGRFLEMGRTDIRDADQVAAEHRGVSYRAFDIVHLDPELQGQILAKVLGLYEQGALTHLPLSSWDLRNAPAAFRHLREGSNIGKVVLDVPRAIDPERTVLITGATGGLGALTARHLAERHGARHLLLVSRSGPKAEGAKELRAELEELGAQAQIAACDVADREALEELLATIPRARPLGAVFHSAGALADGTIESLEEEQIEHVFAPKVDGAWNLHELTKELDLSSFVLFSSAAGTLGGPGQANYAAANVFLDALAQKRGAQGLAATSIAWGLWQRESAMTSHLAEADLARMRRGGVETLSDERGLALLDAALAAERPQAMALPLDPAGLRAQASAGALPPILSGLVRAPKRRGGASGSLVAKLASIPEADRESFVLDLVRSEVAAVLGHGSAAEIEPGRAFKELGFDSLAAVELRNRLNGATGLNLPATAVFDHPTPDALAGHLVETTEGDRKPSVAVGLNQLELMLSTLAADDPGRPQLAAHLRSLAADLEREGKAEARDSDLSRLESASDEELLDFIDEQVGSHDR